ncbi:NADP-dependent oxidoreductase [Rathayibacter sp. YIM 133350]
MARAVRFTEFGGPEVLQVVDIETPVPGEGEVLVEVVAAGTNPVESAIRSGVYPERWPVSFPEGQGRDLAGVVTAVGPGVTRFKPRDEVMGFVARGSHATHVAVPESQLARKPHGVAWEIAGSLYVAGTTAIDALRDTGVGKGDTLLVTSAAGGVGGLTVQLALRAGAQVVGTVAERNFDYLRMLGATPVAYGPDLAARIRDVAPQGISALADFFGGDSVDVAIQLGVAPARISTVLNWEAVDDYGVERATAGDVHELLTVAELMEQHKLRMPIADVFSLDEVQAAYRQLDRRESLGKIVIGMHPVKYRNQHTRNVDLKQQDATLGVPTPHQPVGSAEALPPVFGHRRGHAPTEPGDPRPAGEA